MFSLGLVLRILHYAGLYVQLSAAAGHVDNHLSGHALFTEVPHDISTQSGEDVEMACSFRGAGSPSYSLEIQWWYIKDRSREQQEASAHVTNNVVPLEETSKDATKISVVKVAGSNISHKLRLSSVKPADEGTYECRVIDFSGTVAQHHRVRAYLQVEPGRSPGPEDVRLQGPGRETQGPHQHRDRNQNQQTSEGRDLKRRSTRGSTDCTDRCSL